MDSKFTLVTLSPMRAREINDYYNQLGEELGGSCPRRSRRFRGKALSIALEEIAAGKIVFERVGPEEDADAAAASAVASVDGDEIPRDTA